MAVAADARVRRAASERAERNGPEEERTAEWTGGQHLATQISRLAALEIGIAEVADLVCDAE